MKLVQCSTDGRRKALQYYVPVAFAVLATVGWIMFLTGFGILYTYDYSESLKCCYYMINYLSCNYSLSTYTGNTLNSERSLSQISMIPHWFVTFLFPLCIALLIVDIIKEYLLLEAINNFIRAIYIFCCGSSMYYFGYYVTLCNECSQFSTASGLGFAGTLISAISMVTLLVVVPVKRMCYNRLHTTAVRVYTKTKSTGDATEHIDTKKNEVYGMSLELTKDSIMKSRSDHQQYIHVYGQAHAAV